MHCQDTEAVEAKFHGAVHFATHMWSQCSLRGSLCSGLNSLCQESQVIATAALADNVALQVPMDQGANALDMITKFTRNSSIAHVDAPPLLQLLVDDVVDVFADILGRKSGPATLT